jgi:HTH-like domain
VRLFLPLVQGVARGSAIGSSPLATVEPVLGGPKVVKFAFLDDYRGLLSKARACRVMGVTDRGLRAWKRRPVSHRQRRDMVLLAHIRDRHRSSLGSYGRPRMIVELNELGVRVGHRRVGRVMRQNANSVIRTRKFKVEEGLKMIWGIIFPTTHEQRSQL